MKRGTREIGTSPLHDSSSVLCVCGVLFEEFAQGRSRPTIALRPAHQRARLSFLLRVSTGVVHRCRKTRVQPRWT